MANVNTLLINANLNHKEISNLVGNADNWFNDAFNNNEDIRLSSLIKILSVIPIQDDHKINSLFDYKTLEISAVRIGLSIEDDSYINNFILSEKDIFMDMIGDWAAMDYRNKLSNHEQRVVEQIRNLIDNN